MRGRIIDGLLMYLETSLNVCVDESDEVVNEMEEISTCTSPMHYPARGYRHVWRSRINLYATTATGQLTISRRVRRPKKRGKEPFQRFRDNVRARWCCSRGSLLRYNRRLFTNQA